MSHSPTRRRPLLLELLEDRSVPAVATSFIAGTLTVTGTPAADTIIVRRVNNAISVDGTPFKTPAAQVRQIIVDGGAGDDTIRLDSENLGGQPLGVPCIAFGGTGNDRIYGAPGPDKLFGQAGNDTIYGRGGADLLSGGDGNDYLNGGDGNDTLLGGTGRDVLFGGGGVNRYQDDYRAPASSAGIVNAIAAIAPGQTKYASPNDIDQGLVNTCSCLAALAAFAKTNPTDLAARIQYDAVNGKYLVPIYANNHWTSQAVSFDGSWTDNEPTPQVAADSVSRDYWPILYQRAYLQAFNVDTSNLDGNQWAVRGTSPTDVYSQNWRYANVALQAITGNVAQVRYGLTDADKQYLQNVLAAGKDVIANTQTFANQQSAVAGTGLVFSHTYAVLDMGSDARGAYVDLKNPWGVDAQSGALNGWSAANAAYFTQGNSNDGVVRVSWATFERAFSTLVAA
jgi:hypothetical protein